MELSASFVKALTSSDRSFGIDFPYIRGCTTDFLVQQILALKELTHVTGGYLLKHRADALRAELDSRPDFQRPRRVSESTAMAWLQEQIEREEC